MKFRKTYIEITNQCNRSCSFCPGTARPHGSMNTQSFARCCDSIAPHARLIHLHVMGEPLLHPELPAILDIAGDHGLDVNLVTNGSLVGIAGDGILGKRALRQVSVSLHGLDHSGSNDHYRDYFNALGRFIARCREFPRPAISLRLWNRDPDGGIPDDQRIFMEIEQLFPAAAGIADRLKAGRAYRVADRVFINSACRFDWPDAGSPLIGDRGFCYGLTGQIAILCDGTVVPCCLDRDGVIALGNILHTPMHAILDSPRSHAIIEGFKRGQVIEDLCRRCAYRLRFNYP